MANYRALARHFPAIVHYPGARKWIRRGDLLAYAPGIETPCLSTDQIGFRHTWFEGRNIGLLDVADYPQVGLVFGSSHVFGYGLASNSETLASQLSGVLNYPVLNVSFPEADSRTFHTMLLRLLRTGDRRITFALVLSGGDFTRYCFTRRADPLFGPPALPLRPQDAAPRDDSVQIENLLQFTSFWTQGIVTLARQVGLRLIFADDVTFFEKTAPDEIEQSCVLGSSSAPDQQARFEAHRERYPQYAEHRRRLAAERGLTLLPFPPADELYFIDEYHYRAETQALIANTLAPALA